MYKTDQFDKAIVQYNKALELDPKNVETLIKAGNSYKDKLNNDKAIEYYQKALSLQSENSNAKFNMGLTFAEMGKTEEARKYYNEVIFSTPDFSYAYYALGLLEEQSQNYQAALRNYQQYLTLSPTDENAKGIEYKIKELKGKLPVEQSVKEKATETEDLKSFPTEQQLNQVMTKTPETGQQVQETKPVQNKNIDNTKYIPDEPKIDPANLKELPPLIIEDKAFQGN